MEKARLLKGKPGLLLTKTRSSINFFSQNPTLNNIKGIVQNIGKTLHDNLSANIFTEFRRKDYIVYNILMRYNLAFNTMSLALGFRITRQK